MVFSSSELFFLISTFIDILYLLIHYSHTFLSFFRQDYIWFVENIKNHLFQVCLMSLMPRPSQVQCLSTEILFLVYESHSVVSFTSYMFVKNQTFK